MATSNAPQNNNVGYYDSAKVVPRAKQVRRLNNDFEYLKSEDVSPYASNDAKFNAEYKTKGLQSQSPKDKKRNFAANDDSYEEGVEEESRRIGLSKIAQSLALKKTATLVKKNLLKARVSAVNTSVFAWGGSLWFFVQLPFAILSILMLAVAYAVSETLTASRFVGSIAAWLASKAAEAVNVVFGVDLSAIADGIFLMAYTVVFAIGLITIAGAYLQYSFSFLKPLSGEKAGLKLGSLLLALICYCIPVLNMFPCTLLWMAVVWKYPR